MANQPLNLFPFSTIPPYLSDPLRHSGRMKKVVVRNRTLKPGDVVSVSQAHGMEGLPKGLPTGTVVTVVRVSTGFADVVDENGHPWTISFPHIEMPCSLWWKGEWIDRMTHPDGQTAWAAFLTQAAHAARELRVKN